MSSRRPHPAVAARRRQVSRARGRRRRVSLLAVLGVAAAVAALWWAVTGPLTAIRAVAVEGYELPDREQLSAELRAAAEEGSMLRLPTRAVRDAAAPFPWVGQVEVRRDWPTGLRVTVTAAEPVAAVTGPGAEAVLVSEDARVLGRAGAREDLPRVRLREATPPVGARLDAGSRPALQLAGASEPVVARRLRELRMVEGRLVGRLVDGPELRLGGPTRMVAKAVALRVVLNQLSSEDEAAAEYIDLTLPERPAVGGVEPLPEAEGDDAEAVDAELSTSP